MKILRALALISTLLIVPADGTLISQAQNKCGGNMISSNKFIAKGGIGIVNTHLYIDLNSAENELILDDGKRWAGQSHAKEEVVYFFENRIWSNNDVPQGFNLGKAIVISFEGDNVRFFDFGSMFGGYYRRNRK